MNSHDFRRMYYYLFSCFLATILKDSRTFYNIDILSIQASYVKIDLFLIYLYFSNYVARKQGVKKCAYIRGEIENKIIISQLAT